MSKANKIFFPILFILIIAAAVLVYEAPPAPPPAKSRPAEPLKIGSVLPLSGDGAKYGKALYQAAALAQEEINAIGGAAGQQLEIIWEDGKCDSREATVAGQKLININGIKIILGGFCQSETLALAPLAEAAKTIVISPANADLEARDAKGFVFRLAPSEKTSAQAAAVYSRNTLKANKAIIISDGSDRAQDLRQTFKTSFQQASGAIAGDEVISASQLSRQQISKIKNISADIIYVLAAADRAKNIIKQLKEKNISGQILINGLLAPEKDFGTAKSNGSLESAFLMEQYFDASSPALADLANKYKEKYNEDLLFPEYAANAYSAIYLIKEAVEKMGADPEKIRDYFYNLRDWPQALGNLSFSPSGERANPPFVIKKFEANEIKQIEIYTFGQ